MFKASDQNRIKEASARRSSGFKGFTLIEVMVAMLILLVGMLTFFQLLLTSIKINQTNRQYQLAQDTVSQELETIKTVGYAGIKNNTVLTTTSNNFGYKSALTGLNANYQMTGIDTSCNAPASYCVYKGFTVSKTVSNNPNPVKYYYTLKLSVDPGYLTYPALAQVDAKVYWQAGTKLKSIDILSFVGL